MPPQSQNPGYTHDACIYTCTHHTCTYAHIHTHAQPNTDIVVGAADGIGFFVNDRFASLIGREVGWRLSDGQE